MTNIYIHIVRLLNGEENIIFSNLPEQYKSDAVSCKKKVEYVKGATDKKYKARPYKSQRWLCIHMHSK